MNGSGFDLCLSDGNPPDRPLRLDRTGSLPACTAVVLAPHPDDFDAIAVTLRHLHERGGELHLVVLTTGISGVRDDYPGASSDGWKVAIREAEQRASCRLFGLPEGRLSFMRLAEDDKGHQREDAGNAARLREYLRERRPALVFMPHGNDSNVAHQRTWSMFRDIAVAEGWAMWACLNRDAKTVDMRADAYMPFDQAAAEWKAALLRAHDSQQRRNLITRGYGFDRRVLDVNARAAQALELSEPYAEVFELRRFGR